MSCNVSDASEFYLIDHYDSFSLNLVDWLTSYDRQITPRFFHYDHPELLSLLELNPKPIVLSPGPKSPSEVEQSVQIVERFIGQVPILGVCLGHQILGKVFDFSIGRSQNPLHGELENIKVSKVSKILKGLGSGSAVARYNSLAVSRESSSSDELLVTARNKLGEVMCIEYLPVSGQPAFGLQFHPESFLMIDRSTPILTNWWKVVDGFYAVKDRMDSVILSSKVQPIDEVRV